ncbi:hypothetical protein JZ751_025166 [Albula glossodonta]|uniref:Perilipin n=1 Tax=Albula glossodonta TaxID=121402 RepID=A0A8T2PFJ0_9TELE|nr:hypothetical protein JZ751_025166 [Albula glossodonta]
MAEPEVNPEVSRASERLEAEEQQSVVSRMGNLPLVSSACSMVSNAYTTTKDSVPLLRGVMDAAESGAQILGAVATTGSKPLLDRLEPQIAVVNQYAMMGLDKAEQNLPILQQPADKGFGGGQDTHPTLMIRDDTPRLAIKKGSVNAHMKLVGFSTSNKLVSDTVGMVYQSVSGAKDAVTGAVLGAVMGGVELTRAAVSGGLNTMLGSRVGQMVTSGVGLALSRSENWVDQNLPLTEKELAAVAEPAPAEEAVSAVSSRPSYFVRLGNLSSKVRDRALEQSLVRARHARDVTHTTLAQIGSTLDLLESARTTLTTANTQLSGASEQLLHRWAEWQQGQPMGRDSQGEEESHKDQGEQLEWRTLSMVRGLSAQLQSACLGVVSSAQGLPGAVQDQLASARRAAEELQSSFGNTSNLTPVLLEQSRRNLTQVRQSLDNVMEYLLNNTPLNWLVGPFAPQLTEKGEERPPEDQGATENQGQ